MSSKLINRTDLEKCSNPEWSPVIQANPLKSAVLALALLVGVAGCQTSQPPQSQKADFSPLAGQPLSPDQQRAMQALEKEMNQNATPTATTPPTRKAAQPEALLLREADVVRISFPGAPNLNTVQPIRRDGKIALPLIGEVQAAGLAPTALEKELIRLYGPQLQVKEVAVSLESSAFPVYVTGAVLRPGKIMSDRPLTALEAIMEAGGFDYTKANLKAVKVIRNEKEYFTLNMKKVLQGQLCDPFKLKPSDMVYVPERFSLF